jgi:hypothetical protein
VAAEEAGGPGEDCVRHVGGLELLEYVGCHGGCCGKSSSGGFGSVKFDSRVKPDLSHGGVRQAGQLVMVLPVSCRDAWATPQHDCAPRLQPGTTHFIYREEMALRAQERPSSSSLDLGGWDEAAWSAG